MTAFEQARETIAKRIRSRSISWQREARRRSLENRRALLIKAAEAEACAQLVEAEPDMAAARKVSEG